MRLTSMYMSRSESLGEARFVDLMVKLFTSTYHPNATAVFTLRRWTTEELIVPMGRTLGASAGLNETITSAIVHRLAGTPVDTVDDHVTVDVDGRPFVYAFDGVYVGSDVVRDDLALWFVRRNAIRAAIHRLATRVIGP